MSAVAHKTEIEPLDGTPEKRMFWSIISDYDLKTGLCELIDNAVDLWMLHGRRNKLTIAIELDSDRQLITISDNAGGVNHESLRLLIAPGGSRNDPLAESIGIFGVGSKRAVIALAEQVSIKTRSVGDHSYQIDISKEWMQAPGWELPAYRIPDIKEGQTSIELSCLRKTFQQPDIDLLVTEIGEIYDWFLEIDNCLVTINGRKVKAISFDNWYYPPGFEPRAAIFQEELKDHGKIQVDILAGLIADRNPETENYGVYFYCNNRLIVKALRSREVGYFVTSEAGVPHPDASLCRVIVRLNGSAILMPWNSSKTGINFSHEAFQQLRPTVIDLVRYFTKVSRALKDEWDSRVFAYPNGEVVSIPPKDVKQGKKLILPPIPLVRKSHSEQLKTLNKAQIHEQPWTLGLVEAVAAVELMTRQRYATKNRISLILLDSNFEIALKEFIVHRQDLFPDKIYNDKKIEEIFERRYKVISHVTQKVSIPKKLLDKASHYYRLRNKLVHERATVGITDYEIEDYREVVQDILGRLFSLAF